MKYGIHKAKIGSLVLIGKYYTMLLFGITDPANTQPQRAKGYRCLLEILH